MKTVAQVAHIFGVTKQTVHYWMLRGTLKAKRVGWYFIIEDDEVERLKKIREEIK